MFFSDQFVQGIDLVDIALWAFTIFFVFLVVYLQREGTREGYPMEEDTTGRKEHTGIFFFPPKKTYKLPHGRGTIEQSFGAGDTRPLALKRTAAWPGAPFAPTGDPMRDGVGPASWAERADVVDLTGEGLPRITPYRVNPGYYVPKPDLDPRGCPVLGLDGKVAGTVVDLWVDRSEAIIRYLEVEVSVDGSGRRVLLPMPFCIVNKGKKRIEVDAVTAAHFAHVPGTKDADSVTRREEDMISGYYGGGKLYATPQRAEPWL
jgi:photosynthetic reaction center H subunit